MRILLDAYFDNNFGDDLFADILLKRYPDALFYAFWKNTPESVLGRAARFRNLVILPGGCAMQESWPFDAFVMIGGDVLPDGVDYSERIARMKHVKECGGFVAMLGFSLYKEYGEKTARDLKTMAELADAIVIRDHYSAERFKALVPGAKVVEATDMVFAGTSVERVAAANFNVERKHTHMLGIIPRRKLYSTDEEHLAYCKGQAAIADTYLQKYPDGKVRFLAYSTGEYDDRVTSKDILALMKEAGGKECVHTEGLESENAEVGGKECTPIAGLDSENKQEDMENRAKSMVPVMPEEKVQIVAYEGNIAAFSAAIGECTALLPTRFHGLVFALKNHQPFVPVPYEVKLTQLLDELSYEGVRVPYGQEISAEIVQQAIEGLVQFGISEASINAYEQKASGFFEAMDVWYADSMKVAEYVKVPNYVADTKKNGVADIAEKEKATTENIRRYPAILCLAGEERKNLREENQMLTGQVEELNKWIQSLQQQRAEFEAKCQELEDLRSSQAQELLDIRTQLMDTEMQCQRMEAEYQLLSKAQDMEIDQCKRELESQKRMAKAQEEELMNWVTSLQKERANFERQNLELESIRQWQWDQLMRVPLMSHKLQSEYNGFLQSLREKLDKQSGL